MEYRTISFESIDGVGTLTLNRPERLNALSVEMLDELTNLLTKLGDDLETRVVIIRGAGRAFCAGTDLKGKVAGFNTGGLGEVQYKYNVIQRRASGITRSLRSIPQPLIAAVRGPAAGAGMSIALACDVRIAEPSTRFNAAFIKVGLSGGDMGASYFLPRLIGLSRASEYLLTGRFMDAATAERIGLVSKIVPEDQLDTAARELAEEMIRNSPLGLRVTKELLNVNVDAASLEAAIQIENRTQILCSLTEDADEGALAFVEKRPPRWQNH